VLPLQKSPEMRETEITLISEGTVLEGTIELAAVARVHGVIKGKLIGRPGSMIVLGPQSQVEGSLQADQLWIEGFVRGQVSGKTKIILAPSARVVADIECPCIEIEPGAYFEGSLKMEHVAQKVNSPSPDSGTTQPSA